MASQLRLGLERAPDFSRRAFLRSDCNEAAFDQIEGWPAWRSGLLALVGPSGSGKTHLAGVWAQRAGARALPADLANLDLLDVSGPLLLEDADRQPHGEALFHLMNMAARSTNGLLMTARAAPSAWCTDVPDLRSRLNALPVAQLNEPDDAVLAHILEKFFFERNIRPGDELLAYLVRRIERSATKAQEIVIKLDQAADRQARSVSRSLAREILEGEVDCDGDAQ